MNEKAQSSVNKEWVLEKLEQRRISMRDLARQIGWDVSMVSRTLSGKRQAKLGDVPLFAQALGTGVQETAVALGLRQRLKGVPITLSFNAKGEIRNEEWDETMEVPMAPQGSVGLRAVTSGTRYEMIDGWTFIAGPPSDQILLARLCLLELEDGRTLLGKVMRQYPTGKAVILYQGEHGPENLSSEIEGCREIVLIFP